MSTKFGLKVWSRNNNYVDVASKLYKEGFCDFIEIFAFPGTEEASAPLWKATGAPFVVHAPHFMQGLNFSDKDKYQSNMKIAADALRFADKLNADTVIFHPGIKGDYKETARQMKTLKDSRIVVENKPFIIAKAVLGLKADDNCVGYSPSDIGYIIQEAGVGFCLDMGHAICAANGQGIDKMRYLQDFMIFRPKMFHISDGDWDGAIDKHYNIGAGSYHFEDILKLLPPNPIISVETEKSSDDNLDDFKEDVAKLKGFLNTINI